MSENYNKNIVELIENEPRISHRVIAEQTENQAKSILDSITRNIADFEDFGMVRFEIVPIKNSKNRVNEEKTYFLNEQQATLLMSYLRNNPIVKNFKKLLVKEFFRMRELLQTQNSQNLQLPEIGNSTEQIIELDNYFMATANLIENLESKKPTTLFRLDKYVQRNRNFSPLEHFEIDLDSQFFLPTELGRMISKSAVEINLMIEHKGFQLRENGIWKMTSSGEEFGIEINGQFSQIKWKIKTVL